jgi:hypothetical protein
MATESHQTPPGEGMEPPYEDDGQAPDAEQKSFMDQLRARRTAIAEDTKKVFAVPGYDDLLMATYKRMEYAEVMQIVRRVTNSDKTRDVLSAHADLIIRACVSLDAADGTHIADGYDITLAGFFGYDTERAREIVTYVFANDLAMAAHSNQVLAWMQSSQPEIAEEFQGE